MADMENFYDDLIIINLYQQVFYRQTYADETERKHYAIKA